MHTGIISYVCTLMVSNSLHHQSTATFTITRSVKYVLVTYFFRNSQKSLGQLFFWYFLPFEIGSSTQFNLNAMAQKYLPED